MLLDNLIEIGAIHIAVPGCLRVNDDDRPFGAAVQAAGAVDADLVGNGRAKLLDALLNVVAGFLGAALLAAPRSVRPQVGAKRHGSDNTTLQFLFRSEPGLKTMTTRYYTPVDALLVTLDQALRTVVGQPATTGCANPAVAVPPAELPPEARSGRDG